MKKSLCLGFILFFVMTSVFANIELSEKFYLSPVNQLELQNKENDQKSLMDGPSWFGFDVEANFFFGSPCSFIDLGLNARFGFDYLSGYEFQTNNISDSNKGIGMDLAFVLGPVIRFNVGERHSFVITPGLKFGMLVFMDESNLEQDCFYSFLFEYNLGLGYRFWLVNKGGFHFGLTGGVNLSYPVAGFSKHAIFDDIYEFDVISGLKTEIFLGVVFNFGDRSIEKFAN